MTTWTEAVDDVEMKDATNAFGAWIENEARKRDLLDDFVYLNYANGEQRVYERSVTAEDLQRLKDIRKAYDSSGAFQRLWKGGFKLPTGDSQPSDSPSDVEAQKYRDEL